MNFQPQFVNLKMVPGFKLSIKASAAIAILMFTPNLIGCASYEAHKQFVVNSSAVSMNPTTIGTVLAYPKASNRLRLRLEKMETKDSNPGMEKKIANLVTKIKALDNQAYLIVKPWIDEGYWTNAEPRNHELDKAVWLVVQHSKDLELQKTTLSQVEPLVKKGIFDGQEYSLMYDRVAVTEGRPQKYGSQVHCVAGAFEFFPIEDEANVDQRRQAMGFVQTLSEYRQFFVNEKC